MTNKKPFTLLYAEDDVVVANGYTQYFETIFKKVLNASDGKEAYKLYKEHKPDILLLDISMPHLNGLELIEKIRKDDKEVKIIILTAFIDHDKLLRAIPLNLTRYLTKPIKKRDLEDVLSTTISELETCTSHKIIFSDEIYWDRDKNILIDNNNNNIHLTKNEIILLNLLSSKSRINYSLDNILEEFWHNKYQQDMTENSIRNIIKRLKSKLPKNSIDNTYGIGYKLSIQL